jgi:hypothetical protein
MTRPVRILFYGDSLLNGSTDEGDLGGIPGRTYDLLVAEFGAGSIQLVGQFAVENHAGQFHEGHGGQESQALIDGVDNLLMGSGGALPSGTPMLGYLGRFQNIDLLVDAGGGGDVNDHLDPAVWADMQYERVFRLRTRLNDTDPDCIIVRGNCTDWGGADAPAAAANHQSVLDYNAELPDVHDALDAAFPSSPPLNRDWDAYAATGEYSVNGPLYWGADIVHHNAAGSQAQADALFDVLQPLVAAIRSAPMGTVSTFAKTAALNYVLNKAAYTPAATHFAHLYIAGVAVSGNGYAPVSKTNNTTTWPNATGRTKSNGTQWDFPAPTGNWGNVDEIRITDNATPGDGEELFRDTFTAVPVGTTLGPGGTDTGPFSIPPGFLVIPWGTTAVAVGGFADAVVHGLLNLIFGGTAYAQLATTYCSHWAGDPLGGGTQAGSRVAITQASVWGTAAAGQATSIADITLTQQATGTYFAIHDASSGGNLLFSCPRPALVGASGTILTGQLFARMP